MEKRHDYEFVIDLLLLGVFDLVIGMIASFVALFPFWFAVPVWVTLMSFLIFYNYNFCVRVFNQPPIYGTWVR